MSEERRVRVKLAGVGPLTRSTFSRDHPNPEWERICDVRYWCWCTRFQARRFQNSLRQELDGGEGRVARKDGVHAATSFDEHTLVVTASNLDRAITRLGEGEGLRNYVLDPRTLRAIRLLRNIYEHWDEQKSFYRNGETTGSATHLAKEFPNANPWSFAIHPDDVIIANVISLAAVTRDVRRLEAHALLRLRQLRREGKDRPRRDTTVAFGQVGRA